MKGSKRKAYLNDIKMNEAGKYEYQGKHYVFAGSGEEQKKAYLTLWLLYAALAAVLIGSGFISAGGMRNTFYVIIPYIGELCALFALSWNHVKLLTKWDEIREYVYNQAHPKIPTACAICAAFCIVSFALSLIYSILSGFEGGAAMCVVYLVLKAACTALLLFYRNYFIKVEWIIL